MEKGLTFSWNPGKQVGPEVSTLKETRSSMGTSGCLVYSPGKEDLEHSCLKDHQLQIAWLVHASSVVLAPRVKALPILSGAGPGSNGQAPLLPLK